MNSSALSNNEIKSLVHKSSVTNPKITFSIDDILHEKNNNVNVKNIEKTNINEVKIASRKLMTNNKESETNSR